MLDWQPQAANQVNFGNSPQRRLLPLLTGKVSYTKLFNVANSFAAITTNNDQQCNALCRWVVRA